MALFYTECNQNTYLVQWRVVPNVTCFARVDPWGLDREVALSETS